MAPPGARESKVFLGPIASKSLVMWTMEREGDGYVAAATIALRTS
jgi:hypothetical protein